MYNHNREKSHFEEKVSEIEKSCAANCHKAFALWYLWHVF